MYKYIFIYYHINLITIQVKDKLIIYLIKAFKSKNEFSSSLKQKIEIKYQIIEIILFFSLAILLFSRYLLRIHRP